ncbi:MAG: type II toxin-antitoxin system VapC family toxin [Spirochaetaceae bacterium]|jgi:hypothetical protein|nr:type II toxin-antitoxin system VapC family toxin [Spirochaetaceae bacterium]
MTEVRKSLYVESTIPSYITGWDNKDVITLGKQMQTRKFWGNERHKYDLFTSQYVLDEIRNGDPEAARKRLDLVEGITTLPKTAETDELAAIYQKQLGIPDRAKLDCNHLAVCVLRHINYLLTWNCAHLGVMAQVKIHDYNREHGLWTPLLATPDVLVPSISLKEIMQ